MLTAITLIRSTKAGLATVGPELAAIDGVSEVYTVTGDWDFVAVLRVRQHDELAALVTERIVAVPGIEKTTTMVAFKQFSRHDLEAIFSLGPEA